MNNTGTEHRNELVRELNGVEYYNDSCPESPNHIVTALNAFHQRVILITGGYDKQIFLDSFGEVLLEKVRHLILIGQSASQIEMAVMRKMTGKYRGVDLRITRCNTLQQAVDCAYLSAKPGEIVLFSPASLDFDTFRSFEECGNKFREYVRDL